MTLKHMDKTGLAVAEATARSRERAKRRAERSKLLRALPQKMSAALTIILVVAAFTTLCL